MVRISGKLRNYFVHLDYLRVKGKKKRINLHQESPCIPQKEKDSPCMPPKKRSPSMLLQKKRKCIYANRNTCQGLGDKKKMCDSIHGRASGHRYAKKKRTHTLMAQYAKVAR
jgi:hypothetical protein